MAAQVGFNCPYCNQQYRTFSELSHHLQVAHMNEFNPNPVVTNDSSQRFIFEQQLESVNGHFQTYFLDLNDRNYNDLYVLFDDIWNDLTLFLVRLLELKRFIKVSIAVDVDLLKTTEDRIVSDFYLQSFAENLSHPAFTPAIISMCRSKIENSLEKFTNLGSDFTLFKIKGVYCSIAVFRPLFGGCHIPLPEKIYRKNACLNISRAPENFCFLFCILAQLFPPPCNKRSINVTGLYLPHLPKLKYDPQLDVPMKCDRIELFASNNNLSISVLGLTVDNEIYPILPSKTYQSDENRNIVLLYLQNAERQHYCLVKDVSKLFGRANQPKHYFCTRCLSKFPTPEKRNTHATLCVSGPIQRLRFNRRNVSFTQHAARVKSMYFGVLDTESYLVPNERLKSSDRFSYTERVNTHKMAGFAFAFISEFGDVVTWKSYVGPRASFRLIQDLLIEANKLCQRFDNKQAIAPLNDEEESLFRSVTHCQLCESLFTDTNPRIRDHRHSLNNRLRAVICKRCNKSIEDRIQIQVLVQNLSYDAPFIMSGLSDDMDYKVLGRSMRDIIAIEIGGMIRIVDSLSFIQCSLDKAASTLLKEGRHNFKIFDQVFKQQGGFGDQETELLLRKLPFPYEYFTGLEVYSETSLPPKEAFNSRLKGTSCSDDDYELVKNIWSSFGLRTLKDLTLLYVLVDTLLLGCIIFRVSDIFFENLKLCMFNFITLPSLAYQSNLLACKTKISLITCPDMYSMIASNLRGGMAQAGRCRYMEASNSHVGRSGTHADGLDTYLIYIDIISSYNYSLCQSLAWRNLRWMEVQELKYMVTKIDTVDFETTNFVLSVDLHYPEHLRNDPAHINLPIVFAHETVPFESMSPLQQSTCRASESMKNFKPTQKLMATFLDKKNYVCLASNLLYYIQKGIQVTAVHRGFAFDCSPWCRKFVNQCTDLRNGASSGLVAAQSKILANSLYGRNCMRAEQQSDIKLITSNSDAMKYASSPLFKNFSIVNNKLTMASMRKGIVNITSSPLAGFMVAEHSKLTLIKMYHDVIVPEFGGSRATTMMMDTDSLLLGIRSKVDVYDWIKSRPDVFNMSDKKIPGLWALEYKDHPIRRAVVHRAKAYGIDMGEKTHMRLKGVSKNVTANQISFEDLKQALFEGRESRHIQRSIRVFPHNVVSEVEQNKKSISLLDTKRYYCSLTKSRPYSVPQLFDSDVEDGSSIV